MQIGSMIVLNELGDTTIAWDAEQHDKMVEFIKKKMDEGYSFFIITPRLGGIIRPKSEKLTDVKQLKGQSAVSVSDSDFFELMRTGTVTEAERAAGDINVEGRAKTAEEAATSATVAVKPRRGG